MTISDSDRRKLESAIAELPPMSSAAVAVLQKIEEPSCSLADLESIIESDAALTLRVLKQANSGAVGAIQDVESLSHAASILGERTLVGTALAMGASSLVSEPLPGYHLTGEDLLASSLNAATAARLLASEHGGVSPATAFTAGLLRDVGKVVLSSMLKPPAIAENERANADTSVFGDFLAYERAAIGLDHCEVGRMVAEHYDLAEGLRIAIAHHHAPGEIGGEHADLLDIVHVADAIVSMAGGYKGLDGLSYRLENTSLERLGISTKQFQSFVIEALIEGTEMIESVAE